MKFNSVCSRRFSPALSLVLLAVFATLPASLHSQEHREYLPAGQPDPAILAPPPGLKSDEQAADMAQVVAVFRASTSNQTAQAFSEKNFSVFNLATAIGGYFQSNNLPKTTAFFERVQTQAEVATDLAKEYWKRPRPFTTDPSLASGTLEKSFC